MALGSLPISQIDTYEVKHSPRHLLATNVKKKFGAPSNMTAQKKTYRVRQQNLCLPKIVSNI